MSDGNVAFEGRGVAHGFSAPPPLRLSDMRFACLVCLA